MFSISARAAPPPKSMVRSRSRSDRKVKDHTICGCGGAIIHCVVQEVLACGTERWGPCQTSHSARPGFLQSHDCPIKASSETLYRRFPALPSAPGNLCGDRLWTPHKICKNRTSALQITVCARMLYCIYLQSVHQLMKLKCTSIFLANISKLLFIMFSLIIVSNNKYLDFLFLFIVYPVVCSQRWCDTVLHGERWFVLLPGDSWPRPLQTPRSPRTPAPPRPPHHAPAATTPAPREGKRCSRGHRSLKDYYTVINKQIHAYIHT